AELEEVGVERAAVQRLSLEDLDDGFGMDDTLRDEEVRQAHALIVHERAPQRRSNCAPPGSVSLGYAAQAAAVADPPHALGQRPGARDHGDEWTSDPGGLPLHGAPGRDVDVVAAPGLAAAGVGAARRLARRGARLAFRDRVVVRRQRAPLRGLPGGERRVA